MKITYFRSFNNFYQLMSYQIQREPTVIRMFFQEQYHYID
jgi:hypothetical protein